jgi:hypothetical protein
MADQSIKFCRNLLPQTGQATGYRTGDDGDFEAGQNVPSGEGFIIDRHTDLMWVKQPELIIPGSTGQIQVAQGTWSNLTDYVAGDLVQGDGAPDALFYVCILANGPGGVGAQEPPNATYWVETVWTASAANLTTPATMDWNNSIDNCLALDYGGYTDWRLPNLSEFMTLLDNERSAVGGAISPLVIQGAFYNTSTTRTTSSGNAYEARLSSNHSMFAVSKATANYVLPVRGGRIND